MNWQQVATGVTSYTTLGGDVLDLSGLTDAERRYLSRCYAAYRTQTAWDQFSHLVVGIDNPLLRQTQGVVTPEVWCHPLYQALRDLEDRLGIQQELVDPDPGDDAEHDPLTGEHAAQDSPAASALLR